MALASSVLDFLGNMSWLWLAIVCGGVPILASTLVRRMRKIRGPVVAGTAEVLSLRQFGSVAVNGPERMVCRLRLGVNVPGREPYSVAIWRNIAPWDIGAYQKDRKSTRLNSSHVEISYAVF